MQVFFLFLFVLIHVNLCRILETLFKQHLEGETSRKKKRKGRKRTIKNGDNPKVDRKSNNYFNVNFGINALVTQY